MDINLKGKTAMVNGSTQGIGKAAAFELASLGARIILVARNEEKLQVVVQEINAINGLDNTFICADFSSPEKLNEKIVGYVNPEDPVHILVNNTGGPPGGLVSEANTEEFLNAFNSHLICNHIMTQALLPGMKKAGYGRIINIISTSVKIPLSGLGVSNTIRGAVANWSKTLSNEVAGFGITVNNVLPGATKTGRLKNIIENKSIKTGKSPDEITRHMVEEIPMKRIGEPEEIAAAIGFLASPAASYINGINLPVDGGRTGCL